MFEFTESKCSAKEIGMKPVSTVNTKAMPNSCSSPELVSVFDRSDENSDERKCSPKRRNKIK